MFFYKKIRGVFILTYKCQHLTIGGGRILWSGDMMAGSGYCEMDGRIQISKCQHLTIGHLSINKWIVRRGLNEME